MPDISRITQAALGRMCMHKVAAVPQMVSARDNMEGAFNGQPYRRVYGGVSGSALPS